MLTKSIVALVFFSVGLVQAAPLRYALPGQTIDLDANPGVRPIKPSNGEVHILPYYPGDGSTVAKREPLKYIDLDSNPGVRPINNGEVHILPYYPSKVSAAKREPLKFDLDSNPGVRPVDPRTGQPVHILPYSQDAKREPLKFDLDSNPGIRPILPHFPDITVTGKAKREPLKFDLDSNPGVRPVDPRTGQPVHILPYSQDAKREPLKFDLDSNPGVRPINPTGDVHILPYFPDITVTGKAKREPLKLAPFDPQANPGVRPGPNRPILNLPGL